MGWAVTPNDKGFIAEMGKCTICQKPFIDGDRYYHDGQKINLVAGTKKTLHAHALCVWERAEEKKDQ